MMRFIYIYKSGVKNVFFQQLMFSLNASNANLTPLNITFNRLCRFI